MYEEMNVHRTTVRSPTDVQISVLHARAKVEIWISRDRTWTSLLKGKINACVPTLKVNHWSTMQLCVCLCLWLFSFLQKCSKIFLYFEYTKCVSGTIIECKLQLKRTIFTCESSTIKTWRKEAAASLHSKAICISVTCNQIKQFLSKHFVTRCFFFYNRHAKFDNLFIYSKYLVTTFIKLKTTNWARFHLLKRPYHKEDKHW
jgi:hypothetical protein